MSCRSIRTGTFKTVSALILIAAFSTVGRASSPTELEFDPPSSRVLETLKDAQQGLETLKGTEAQTRTFKINFINGQYLAEVLKEFTFLKTHLAAQNALFKSQASPDVSTLPAGRLIEDYSEGMLRSLGHLELQLRLTLNPGSDLDGRSRVGMIAGFGEFLRGLRSTLPETLSDIPPLPKTLSEFVEWVRTVRHDVKVTQCEVILSRPGNPSGN